MGSGKEVCAFTLARSCDRREYEGWRGGRICDPRVRAVGSWQMTVFASTN